jgi:hypothetical protein
MSALPRHEGSHPSGIERVTFGLIVMIGGVLLLLDRAGAVDIVVSTRWWPPPVLALGLARFIGPGMRTDGRPRSRAGGFWLVYIGFWGLANEYRTFGLEYATSWPLLMVGGGLSIVWDALFASSESCRATTGDARS